MIKNVTLAATVISAKTTEDILGTRELIQDIIESTVVKTIECVSSQTSLCSIDYDSDVCFNLNEVRFILYFYLLL